MYLKELRIEGFKSFGKSAVLSFPTAITAIVGPNGSGKSNVAEAFRFVMGEQSMKSMRGKRGEDLLFNGGTGANRANRAKVSIVFDNTEQLLNSSFDEVSVSRTVYRNGTNEYAINGTQVRHRDVVELLAKANIGSTGHHIISQGEADRILHASNEERKEILEDGLGLKLLQYRRIEAEKKLRRAQANIAETDLILRETTPHLRHLKRQVERYEKSKKIREELLHLYAVYLAYETTYLATARCAAEEEYDTLQERISGITKAITKEKKKAVSEQQVAEMGKQEKSLSDALRAVRDKRDVASREIGRLEGERAALQRLTKDAKSEPIDREALRRLYKEVQHRFMTADEYGAVITYALQQLQAMLGRKSAVQQEAEKQLAHLQKKQEAVQEQMSALQKEEQQYACAQEALHTRKEQEIAVARQSEKNELALITEKNTFEQTLAEARHTLAVLREDEENIQREMTEGAVLIGSAINNYKSVVVPQEAQDEDREKQKERRRLLERKKIELETIGAGGDNEEIYTEYQRVSERVAFLQTEKKDLLHSMQDCEEGIKTIQKEVETRFKAGVQAISAEFGKLFTILFGGGRATIAIEKRTVAKEGEEPEMRVGVAVQVALPHKKISALEQLSGGERALVSIALLFAISQVTPPPFLILDETDAALDEANSRRYGDMIESLAKQSQLILITHNRETMHRAGALYGVTMGSTGLSALLSVQFDEAVRVAK
ncbi:MAG: AAA family ATPase [Candidatus Kaiserbacteria bacterium]|nr:AAA family ATPase [Candidatus Kaiserbacteria bacterium]